MIKSYLDKNKENCSYHSLMKLLKDDAVAGCSILLVYR